jgi:hypothetical protein
MPSDRRVPGRHPSHSARPGPPPDRPVSPATPSPFKWRHLVLVLVSVSVFRCRYVPIHQNGDVFAD